MGEDSKRIQRNWIGPYLGVKREKKYLK